jgi:hypothetical protein
MTREFLDNADLHSGGFRRDKGLDIRSRSSAATPGPEPPTATSKPSAGLNPVLPTSSRASSSVLVMASMAFTIGFRTTLLQLNSISLNQWQPSRRPRLH